MSTKQQQSQQQNFKQLRSLHRVGSKTVERLKDSESYHSVSDVEEADPIHLKKVIELNYADALWIQTQLQHSQINKHSSSNSNEGDQR